MKSVKSFIKGKLTKKSIRKYGFINKNGQWAIPPKFDYARSFYGGHASVKINEKWGYINKKGEFITPAIFNEVPEVLLKGLTPVKMTDKWGYIDSSGNTVIKPMFDVANPFSEGLAAVKYKGYEWGYINTSGSLVITNIHIKPILPQHKDVKYDSISIRGLGNFSEGLAPIHIKARLLDLKGDNVSLVEFSGYIDKTGQRVIPCVFSDVEFLES